MATAIPKNSVWSAMTYVPPRGRCNYKTSLMSPACPCLRFMLHPVKAATSFECDGCNHHASFHSLENPAEDAILKKWEEQESDMKERKALEPANKKRKRIAEKSATSGANIVELLDGDDDEEMGVEVVSAFMSGKKTRRQKPGI